MSDRHTELLLIAEAAVELIDARENDEDDLFQEAALRSALCDAGFDVKPLRITVVGLPEPEPKPRKRGKRVRVG